MCLLDILHVRLAVGPGLGVGRMQDLGLLEEGCFYGPVGLGLLSNNSIDETLRILPDPFPRGEFMGLAF